MLQSSRALCRQSRRSFLVGIFNSSAGVEHCKEGTEPRSSSHFDRQHPRCAGSHAASAVLEGTRPAFVFDIDGVLLRGTTVLEEAKRALARLYTPCRSRPRIPVAFLTNGGGSLEEDKAKALSTILGVNIRANQVVMSHTPMQGLVAGGLADQPVLLCGKGDLVRVAESYGFRRAISTEHLAAAYPGSVPLSSSAQTTDPKAVTWVLQSGLGTKAAPLAAVLVMTDPTDWGRDIQLIIDTVASGGLPAAPPIPLGPMDSRDPTPVVPVYVGHADLLWAADWPRPRFGLGAFAYALEGLYKEATGNDCPIQYYGKPQPGPFRIVEGLLEEQAKGLGWDAPADSSSVFDAIFMIGDNPRVDVRGANAARKDSGLPWKSVLVRTGVFQAGDGAANCPTDPADIVVEHVDDAISAAGHHLRSLLWHSLR